MHVYLVFNCTRLCGLIFSFTLKYYQQIPAPILAFPSPLTHWEEPFKITYGKDGEGKEINENTLFYNIKIASWNYSTYYIPFWWILNRVPQKKTLK